MVAVARGGRPRFLVGFLAAAVSARGYSLVYYRLSVIPANCPVVSHFSCLFHGIIES